MTRVALFETPEWPICEWNPRKGLTWTGDRGTIRMNMNGAWKRGMPPIQTRDSISAAWRRPPLFASVERTLARRLLPYALHPIRPEQRFAGQYDLIGTPGSNEDGAQVSGAGISLVPEWTPTTIAELDARIERHPGPWMLHFDTGLPLTRDDLGEQELSLDQAEWWQPEPQHFVQTTWTSVHPVTPYDAWKRYAASHLIRAYGPAVAAWNARRDPVARAALILHAQQVMLSFPTRKLGPANDGQWRNELLLMYQNSLGWARGSGQIGVVRWFAWCFRVVVEAQKAAPTADKLAWILMAIETVRNLQTAGGGFGANAKSSAASEQGQPWNVVQYRRDGTPFRLLRDDELECPWWQQPFLIRALREAHRIFKDAMSGGRRVPLAQFDALVSVEACVKGSMKIWSTCRQREQSEWNPNVYCLPYWLIVADANGPKAEITEGIGLGNPAYDGDAFQCASELGIEVPA